MTISKRIVTDENMNPVAVQIDYDDWLAIEEQLKVEDTTPSPRCTELKRLLKDSRGIWKEGDGLEYQRRIRAEWRDPWEEWGADEGEDT